MQAHNIKMTSYQRRCDVITSHRHWYDVILTLCACWVYCCHIFRSLIRFWIESFFKETAETLISTDSHADLRLRWAHMSRYGLWRCGWLCKIFLSKTEEPFFNKISNPDQLLTHPFHDLKKFWVSLIFENLWKRLSFEPYLHSGPSCSKLHEVVR